MNKQTVVFDFDGVIRKIVNGELEYSSIKPSI